MLIHVAWSMINYQNVIFHFREQKRAGQIYWTMSLFWLIKNCLQGQVPEFLVKAPNREPLFFFSKTGNQAPHNLGWTVPIDISLDLASTIVQLNKRLIVRIVINSISVKKNQRISFSAHAYLHLIGDMTQQNFVIKQCWLFKSTISRLI